MKVLYVDATRVKKMLDKYNEVTLAQTELRVELETGKVTLNKKRPKK